MKRSPVRCYSLIELLVVITIIMILAAILFPALRSSRNAAKKAQCLSNQKNIGVYVYNYAYEHNQYIDVLESYQYWYKDLLISNGGMKPKSTSGSPTDRNNYADDYLAIEEKDRKSLTTEGVAMTKVFKCPSDKSVKAGGGTASYARNDPGGGGTMKWKDDSNPDTGKKIVKSRLNDFRAPSDLILVSDRWADNHTPGITKQRNTKIAAWHNGGEYDTTNAFHLRPRDKSSAGIEDQRDSTARHKGDAPILYVDGHVTAVDYLQTIPKYYHPPANVSSGWGNLEKLSWRSGYAVGSWSDEPTKKQSYMNNNNK